MTLKYLVEDLSRFHPLDDTDAVLVAKNGRKIIFETNTEKELREELRDLKDTVDDLEKEAKESSQRADEAENELTEIRNEMDEIKEGEESLSSYRDRAIEAERSRLLFAESARNYRAAMEEMQRELAALRKKKGVFPGLIKHASDIQGLIRIATSDPLKAQAIAKRIQECLR